MAFKSYRNVFVATSGTILSTGTTTDLGVGQIGIFDTKNYQAQTAPNFPAVTTVIVAQGTEDRSVLPDGAGLGNETFKTPEIQGTLIKKWAAKAAQRGQNMIVTLGFDGVDTTKTLSAKPGEIKTFWLKLSGQPILNFFPDQRRYLVEEFTITLPCADECSDNCSATVDCNVVADAIINAINGRVVAGTLYNGRKTVGGQPLSKYVKVSKLVNCGTPSGYNFTICQKWNLSLLDNGTPQALGKVQVQYPGIKVERTARIDALSVYTLTLCDDKTPDPYVENGGTVIPNCTECPSGYTLVDDNGFVFTIGRTDTGNSTALSTIAGQYAAYTDSGTLIRLSYVGGYSTYQVYGSSATSPITNAIAGDTVTLIGTHLSACVGNDGLTVDWTAGATCELANTTFEITLAAPACGGTDLAVLQSIYGDGVYIIADNSASFCTVKYGILVNANEPTCTDCPSATINPLFTPPQAFQGVPWTEVDGVIYGTDCVCGVKFESAYVARESQECFFDSVPYESDPLFIEISERNPDINDFSQLCAPTWPVTLTQGVKYPAGNGRFVATLERLSREYFNDYWAPDPAERDMLRYHFFTDLDQYYDEYVLTFDYDSPVGSFARHKSESFEYHFFFPETTGGQFQNAINAWLSSLPIGVAPIVL